MPTQTLDLKQSLQLRLNQRMQQAIKLLQMSNQEICTFVHDYIQDNPLLELATLDDALSEAFSQDAKDHQNEWPLDEPLFDHEQNTISENSSLYEQKETFENLWPDDYAHEYHEKINASDTPIHTQGDNTLDPLARCSNSISFQSFIISQIEVIINEKDRPLAYAFCDLLNEDGYLCSTWEKEIMGLFPSLSKETINAMLKTLQTLEPTGVFARSLVESLCLQLRYKATQTSHISDHHDVLTIQDKEISMTLMEHLLNKLQTHTGSPLDLAKKLNITADTLTTYLDILRQFNPRPSSAFMDKMPQTLIPDLIMHKNGHDEWVIELNAQTLPNVYLNSTYYTELRHIMKGTKDKKFLNEKYTEAKWLLKSLHQRALNILKVTDYMVRKQFSFFRSHQGVLKPLTLKDVALATNLSESTVSRVTTDKYIQTPRGIFELKYFFSTSLSHANSTTIHSAKTIQNYIQSMIRSENTNNPLSDSDIVERLQLHDIFVARRTVAKYRTLLNIENASMRAKYYKWTQRNDKILAIRT